MYEFITKRLPGLQAKLIMADLQVTPEQFVSKVFKISFMYSAMANFGAVLFVMKSNAAFTLVAAAFPISFFLLFAYFLKLPEMKIIKRKKNIDSEIISAGRFLLIGLASGVPLFQAIKSVSKNFRHTGKLFKKIVDKVELGTPMEQAVEASIEESPSENFRKVMRQLLTSLQTGSDPSKSLRAAVDQIVGEQMIELQKYSKKLNPLAMFYMMIAVIVPSLGVSMLIVFSSLLNLQLELWALLIVAAFIGFLQFMFLSVIKSSRPGVEV